LVNFHLFKNKNTKESSLICLKKARTACVTISFRTANDVTLDRLTYQSKASCYLKVKLLFCPEIVTDMNNLFFPPNNVRKSPKKQKNKKEFLNTKYSKLYSLFSKRTLNVYFWNIECWIDLKRRKQKIFKDRSQWTFLTYNKILKLLLILF
jgi:hypothetical protein